MVHKQKGIDFVQIMLTALSEKSAKALDRLMKEPPPKLRHYTATCQCGQKSPEIVSMEEGMEWWEQHGKETHPNNYYGMGCSMPRGIPMDGRYYGS